MLKRLWQNSVLGCVLALSLASCATVNDGNAPEATADAAESVSNPADPWEGFNRAMFSFNDHLDRYALKPVAKGYDYVMPDLAQQGVSNFFGNLGDVGNFLNDLMQLKFKHAAQDFGRVAFNSTIGLAGILDVATPMGLPKHNEDFGQTLGYWGVPSGPYLVLPFFGPSTVRDGVSKIPDAAMDPVVYEDNVKVRNSAMALRIVDKRANLLKKEEIVTGDRYIFIRDSYLQQREYDVKDGNVDIKYDDSNF